MTLAFAGFPPIAENSIKAALTTGMTTDRKIFIFTPRRGIMAEIEYPGVVQLIERVVWERVAPPSSWKMLCPQSLDTPTIQALPRKSRWSKKPPDHMFDHS